MNRNIAVLLLVLCTMLWGLAFVAQKGAMQHMGPLTFTTIRYGLGSLLVTPLAIREYRRQRAKGLVLTTSHWVRIGLLSAVFFIGVWLQQHALLTATITNGGFLTSLYVIFTPLVGFLINRHKPHPIVYVGAPLALLGIYLLTGANLSAFTLADSELVLGAVFWAIQVSMLGTLVKETGLPIFVSVANFWFVAFAALVGMSLLETPSLSGIGDGWVEIVYSAVFSTGVAFTLQAVGQQYVPASNAAIILSAESLFAALGGALFLGERLPPVGYAGAALIFASILLVEGLPAWRDRRAAAKAA